MKIGVNRWTMPSDWDVERALTAAKEAGFDSIELNLEETGPLSLTSTEQEIRAIRQQADRIAIELSSLSTALFWSYPLTHSDPKIAEQAANVLHKLIETAAFLEVDTALVVPGLVDASASYDVAYQRSLAAIRDAIPFAEKSKVAIGIENVWNKFLLSPLEFARFIDECGSEYVGAYFDVGNILAYGYPQHWIRILNQRIKKVHVKDFKPGIGNIRGFVNIPHGEVPWQEVKAAFAEIGYSGYVTAEVEGYPQFPELGLKHIAESLRTIF